MIRSGPLLFTHHDGMVCRIDYRGQPGQRLSRAEAEAALKRYRARAQALADADLVVGAGLSSGIADEIEDALQATKRQEIAA